MPQLDPKIYKIFQNRLEQFIQQQFDLDLYKIQIKDCLNDGYILCTITPENTSIFNLEHLPIPEYQWLCFPHLIAYLNAVQKQSELAILDATEKSMVENVMYEDSIPFLISELQLFQSWVHLIALDPRQLDEFFNYYEQVLLAQEIDKKAITQDRYLEFKANLCKLTAFGSFSKNVEQSVKFQNHHQPIWDSFVDYIDLKHFCEFDVIPSEFSFRIQIKSVLQPIQFSQCFRLNVSKTVELMIRRYSLLSKQNIIGTPQAKFIDFFTNQDLSYFISDQQANKSDVIFPTLICQKLNTPRNLGLNLGC